MTKLKIPISFLFFLIFANGLMGQIINNRQGEVWTDIPFFNRQYIKDHKIRSINGRYTYKNPGQAMYETDYRHVFEFDTLGRISVIYETKKDDGTEDTVFQIYQYNTKEELIYFSRGTRKSYRYVLYLYDEKSALVSSEFYYHHTKDDGQISTLLERKESYIYEIDGIDTIKITRNSYNFPYKKEWKMYDRHGHVTKIEERFLSNGEGNTEMFEFNTEGFLETKTYKSTKESYPKNILTFDYDTLGNVLEKKIWYQNSVTREIQFVYNESNGKLTAILERENGSDFISIIRFQNYKYFDDPFID